MINKDKCYGIVEGFFSDPMPMWSWDDRNKILDEVIEADNLNAYFYCPKDDDYVVNDWNILYPKGDFELFTRFVGKCLVNNIRFIYGLNPAFNRGKDIENTFNQYVDQIVKKLSQFADIGVNMIALLFDDIPFAYNALQGLNSPEAETFARLQSEILNEVQRAFPSFSILFCSSEYFFSQNNGYLKTINSVLDERITLVWTGNRVFTDKITCKMYKKAKGLVGNRGLIWWDNYPVNDPMETGYLNLGGFNPPDAGVAGSLEGILINPMREAVSNIPNIWTLNKYLQDPDKYNRNSSYLEYFSALSGLDLEKSRTIIDFSSKSAMDDCLKYGYESLTSISSKQDFDVYLDSLQMAVDGWDMTNELLCELIPVKNDIEDFLNLMNGSLDIQTFINWDTFPVRLDAIYLNRILVILLQRRVLAQKLLQQENNVYKELLEAIINSSSINRTVYKQLSVNWNACLAEYNRYLKLNKKMLDKKDQTGLVRVLKNLIEEEQNQFITVLIEQDQYLEALSLSLRKNINQYGIEAMLDEIDSLTLVTIASEKG